MLHLAALFADGDHQSGAGRSDPIVEDPSLHLVPSDVAPWIFAVKVRDRWSEVGGRFHDRGGLHGNGCEQGVEHVELVDHPWRRMEGDDSGIRAAISRDEKMAVGDQGLREVTGSAQGGENLEVDELSSSMDQLRGMTVSWS